MYVCECACACVHWIFFQIVHVAISTKLLYHQTNNQGSMPNRGNGAFISSFHNLTEINRHICTMRNEIEWDGMSCCHYARLLFSVLLSHRSFFCIAIFLSLFLPFIHFSCRTYLYIYISVCLCVLNQFLLDAPFYQLSKHDFPWITNVHRDAKAVSGIY